MVTHIGSNVARYIESQIELGLWLPGEKLPTERELVERFGLARNTVRKGLDQLEAVGKIVRHVGRGTFVAERGLKGVTAVPPDTLQEKIRRASPIEIMDVRLMVEPQAAELAAASATARDFAAMEECVRRGEEASSVPEFEEWDGRLHQRIIDAAHNTLLSDLYGAVNSLRNSTAWGTLKSRSLTPELRSLYVRQHRDIVDALRSRDPDLARDRLRAHLLAVKASFGGL